MLRKHALDVEMFYQGNRLSVRLGPSINMAIGALQTNSTSDTSFLWKEPDTSASDIT